MISALLTAGSASLIIIVIVPALGGDFSACARHRQAEKLDQGERRITDMHNGCYMGCLPSFGPYRKLGRNKAIRSKSLVKADGTNASPNSGAIAKAKSISVRFWASQATKFHCPRHLLRFSFPSLTSNIDNLIAKYGEIFRCEMGEGVCQTVGESVIRHAWDQNVIAALKCCMPISLNCSGQFVNPWIKMTT